MKMSLSFCNTCSIFNEQLYRKKCKSICVPIERGLSGPAIKNIYDFIKFKGNFEDASKNPIKLTPEEIIRRAKAKEDPIAMKTLEMFAKIYGAEAGNFGARALCYGGIYLIGALTEGIKEYLAESKTFFVL